MGRAKRFSHAPAEKKKKRFVFCRLSWLSPILPLHTKNGFCGNVFSQQMALLINVLFNWFCHRCNSNCPLTRLFSLLLYWSSTEVECFLNNNGILDVSNEGKFPYRVAYLLGKKKSCCWGTRLLMTYKSYWIVVSTGLSFNILKMSEKRVVFYLIFWGKTTAVCHILGGDFFFSYFT